MVRKDFDTMGRRRFMKTLAGLGVSGAAIEGLTKETLAELTDDPTDEVPRLKGYIHTNQEAVISGEEPPKSEPAYYTIPREQWVRTEAPRQAAVELRKSLPNDPMITAAVSRSRSGDRLEVVIKHTSIRKKGGGSEGDSARSQGSNEPGRQGSGEISRPSTSADELRANLPSTISQQVSYGRQVDTIESIPVRVEEVVSVYQGNEDLDYYDYKYEDVPGGCGFEAGQTNDNGGTSYGPGTIATPYYNSVKEQYGWLTAAHMFAYKSGPEDSEEGKKAKQPSDRYFNNNTIGNSAEKLADGYADVQRIASNGSRNPEWRLAADGDDSYSRYINGVLGGDKLYDAMATNDDVYVQAAVSGRETTTIEDIGTKAVWTDLRSEWGDSGGVYYYIDDIGNTLLFGVHSAIDNYDARGTRLDYVTNLWSELFI